MAAWTAGSLPAAWPELAAVEQMLREVPERLPILLDLEVPFWDRRRLAGPRTWPQTMRAIDSLVATAGRHHEVWTGEWPPPGVDWPGWLQLRQLTAPAATRSTAP